MSAIFWNASRNAVNARIVVLKNKIRHIVPNNINTVSDWGVEHYKTTHDICLENMLFGRIIHKISISGK